MHHSERLAPDEVALLVTSLKALSGAVSYIDNVHHDSLLNSIFGMSLWKYGPDVMDALLELIIALAASNGKYVDSCLDMLVSNFMPPMYLVNTLKQPRGLAKKEQVLSRVHTALEGIVDLIPMAASRLSSVVVHRMPTTFKKDLQKDHLMYRTEVYVENILRLESGAIREFVGSRMLMAVVDMLIELDVAIGWDDILQDDSCKGIFAIELEDADEVAADDDNDENDYAELPRTLNRKSLGKNIVADLLDSLMVQTFEHLESCARNKRLGEVFETLLDSFMLTILNTYKSKFAQFVMFYACALDPEKCGVKFANTLVDRFVCSDNAVTRMSAVAYLASYLARAKFLSAAFVASTLKRLVDWCLEYCETQNGEMNPKAHRVFYSGCQAIMYVLCFRMRSLMDVPRLKSQLLVMPLGPVLKHKLDPLKVCLPSIVEEFLKQAKAAYLLTTSETFIFEDLLESDFSRDFGGLERLDMFFPFDPCLLKKCDRGYIRPNFVYWKHVRTTYGSDEEDSSDEDITEDFVVVNGESFMEEEGAGSLDEQHLDLDEFDYAMNKMSITPKNGFTYRFGGEQMQMPSRIRPSTTPESL
ncbi:RNA polymerase I-specific transcription initiation factor rrn3 isoform X2 [Hevea brasiliensis]|nr:RNA polymerase I-specific transcription initiation factor rrn3 isoform X2 [Hevea brasiliensis]XP_058009034.1 RNA polymerase I-specific transcription initiation factor rrn3 isoform X2 [Hevea brasiliensis]